MKNRRQFLINTPKTLALAAGVLATGLAATPALADNFPSRNLTLIVPFAPGGNTDVTARIFAKALGEQLKQPVVVDNRPGAGGTIGGRAVAGAKPDGYTLLWSGSSLLSLAPIVYPDLPFDVNKAFQPISRIMTHTLVLVTNKKSDVKTVKQLVDKAKANPGKMNYGSSGIGAIHHFTGELFKKEADINMEHIPYQGNGPAMNDLMAGQMDAMFAGLPQVLPHLDRLNLLAVTSDQRDSSVKDVPTMAEAGYPALKVAQSWYGVLAPAGVPAQVLATLSKASKAAALSAEVVEGAARSGLNTMAEEPQQFQQAIQEENAVWSALVRQTGMTFSK